MSQTTRCPTCGGVAHTRPSREDPTAPPRLVAVSDEAKSKKIEQLKTALERTRAKLEAAEARIRELEPPADGAADE